MTGLAVLGIDLLAAQENFGAIGGLQVYGGHRLDALGDRFGLERHALHVDSLAAGDQRHQHHDQGDRDDKRSDDHNDELLGGLDRRFVLMVLAHEASFR